MNKQAKPNTGKRILLVEDERVVRETLRSFLSMDAHTVIEANNGAEAFALFRDGQFDLVVTDFEMPFVKGNELAVRIKKLSPLQPILMITAYSHRPSSDNPVDAVVSKPCNTTQMRGIVASLLSQPSENRQDAEAVEFQPASTTFETELIPV